MSTSRIRPLLLVAALLAGCCVPLATTADADADPGTLDAKGSVEQIYATGLTAGDELELRDADGDVVATTMVNDLGAALFRGVDPAEGYVVENLTSGATSAPITVHDTTPEPWNPEIHDQTIAPSGYQYLTTRDGTQLAIAVRPPLLGGDGPHPTLIEYSGYGYADPDGPQSGLAVLANAMGFAVVDVNMRGTGCSGGAFDYFEMLQNLDAYDVIETIANQPWVLHNQVGMFGLSYGGISQLFAAQLNPPSLAAISPLSVIDATPTTLYPGGILNNGFAFEWAQGRVDDAKPATADTGQKWAWERIQDGDTVCEANQALHLEAVDLIGKIRANDHYDPAVADPLDPVTFVHKIEAPVFLACQFQDEQTGGHCPELARHFTGSDKWFTFTNGTHIDALAPETLNELFDFLHLFVAEQAPGPHNALMKLAAPIIYQTAMEPPDGVNFTLPHDPIQDETTYQGALAAFRDLPRVQLRMDNGAGSDPSGVHLAGNPYAGYTVGLDGLPATDTRVKTWYLGADGALGDSPPTDHAADVFTADPTAIPRTNFDAGTGGGGLWSTAADWEWNWQPNPEGTAVAYETEPLAEDTTVFGTGAATLWVRSSTPDVDLQVTISEVRPDGVESFVQNGWLRASKRKLSTGTDNVFKRASTPADPIPSFRAEDVQPMPEGAFAEVAIPLYYQGHAYRTGSRIRVVIAAPNGSQPIWAFDETQPAGTTAEVAIARTPEMPSTLMLPVVPGLEVPTPLPECPTLRNEPCRTHEPLENASEELAPPEETTTTTTTSTLPPPTMPGSTTTVPPTDTTAPSTTTPGPPPVTTAPEPTSPVGPTTSVTPDHPRDPNGGPTSTPIDVDVDAGSGAPPPGVDQDADGHHDARTHTDDLPATGTAAWGLIAVGSSLIVIGAALHRTARRRTA